MRVATTRVLNKILLVLESNPDGLTHTEIKRLTGNHNSVKDGLLFLIKVDVVEKVWVTIGQINVYRVKK